MAAPNQVFWVTTSGLGAPVAETTGTPTAVVRTTSGEQIPPANTLPVLSIEEREWSSLLTSERSKALQKRITARTVNKAIRQLRYSR
jgi:hypothetical protein